MKKELVSYLKKQNMSVVPLDDEDFIEEPQYLRMSIEIIDIVEQEINKKMLELLIPQNGIAQQVLNIVFLKIRSEK